MTETNNPVPPKTAMVLKPKYCFKPGQDLKGFADELKELMDEDKVQLAVGISNGSLNY